MPTRLLLLCLLTAGCAPALTMRRLSPPRATIGPTRVVRVSVINKSTQPIPELPASQLEDWVRQQFVHRLEQLRFTVCAEDPCGDAMLEITLHELSAGKGANPSPVDANDAQLQAAMAAYGFKVSSSTSAEDRVWTRLKLGVAVKQPVAKPAFSHTWAHSVSKTEKGATEKSVAEGALREVVNQFEAQLALRAPLVDVDLEGGGPLNRGLELLHKGDAAGAVAYFSQLTTAQPELDGAWYDLGIALEAQGQWGRALEAYEAALLRAPTRPHYQRAAKTAARVLHGTN